MNLSKEDKELIIRSLMYTQAIMNTKITDPFTQCWHNHYKCEQSEAKTLERKLREEWHSIHS